MIWLVGANGTALRTAWDSSSLADDVRAYSHDEAIQALAFSFGAALLFATVWLLFMLHCVKTAVYLTYLTVLLSEIAGTSGLFYLAGYDGWKPFNGKFLYSIAALLTLVTLYTVYLGWKLKSRVDLCASMVNITGTVLQSSPAVFVVAVLLVGVKFAYVVLCSAAMWTVHTDVSEYTSAHKNLITFGLVFMSFWGLSVISNIVMVTLYGTLGRWYHGQPAAVCNSLLRAVSTSFGSICCGSLVVASIQTSHKVCEFFQKKGWIPRWLMCIVDYIFSLLEAALESLNTYGFVQVAVNGLGFVPASKRAMQFLKYKGLTALLTESILSRLQWLGSLAAAVLCGFAAVASCKYILHVDLEDHAHTSLLVAASTLGYFVVYALIAPLHSMSTALLVLFAESPEMLANAHPEQYSSMMQSWRVVYGEEFVDKMATLAHHEDPKCDNRVTA